MVVLLLVWAALLGAGLRVVDPAPDLGAGVAVASIALWFGLVTAGGAWLGWTA